MSLKEGAGESRQPLVGTGQHLLGNRQQAGRQPRAGTGSRRKSFRVGGSSYYYYLLSAEISDTDRLIDRNNNRSSRSSRVPVVVR
jgi:hypothetical protein